MWMPSRSEGDAGLCGLRLSWLRSFAMTRVSINIFFEFIASILEADAVYFNVRCFDGDLIVSQQETPPPLGPSSRVGDAYVTAEVREAPESSNLQHQQVKPVAPEELVSLSHFHEHNPQKKHVEIHNCQSSAHGGGGAVTRAARTQVPRQLGRRDRCSRRRYADSTAAPFPRCLQWH